MNFFQISRPIDPVFSETVFRIAGFPINNSTLFGFFILLLLAFFCFFFISRFAIKPGTIQVIVELLYESMENLLSQITGDKKGARALMPFIGALFVFIGLSNLLGMVPIITSITFDNILIFRSPTSDFNTTFSLAVAAIIVIQLLSIRSFGFLGYLGKFLRFKEVYLGFRKGISDGLVAIINLFVGLLDIIGEFSKAISLSLRLFGNVYAGIVLSTIALGALAYLLPSVWLALGLLFGIVQATVFGSLVAVYYVLAMKSEEG